MTSQKEEIKLKKLTLLAKQNINSRLHLQRTKTLKYTNSQYFAVLLLISLFCVFAEGGGQVANMFGDLPVGDSLLDQLKKLKEEEIAAKIFFFFIHLLY